VFGVLVAAVLGISSSSVSSRASNALAILGRERHRIQPGLWTPQLRPEESFRAVMEDLLDLDHEGEDGPVTLDDQGLSS
jgi:hypothetical protein